MNIFTKHISLFHVKHLNYKISYYTQTKTQISSHSIIVIIKSRISKNYPYTPTNDSQNIYNHKYIKIISVSRETLIKTI